MSNEVWKSFEDNTLTHSAAHYLMTIKALLEDHGYARVTDIAKRLNITRGSCSISLKPLKKRQLVIEDENRFLQLSDEGRRLAEMIEMNDDLLECLFKDVLGVSADQAEVDACKIEHLLSIESSVKLANFIKSWKENQAASTTLKKQMDAAQLTCNHDVENCGLCQSVCFTESLSND
ncbi:MAG: DtxR family Mn-dependent transcriptional regulator [Kiritimatiellia bacterium]|jgi:DtxR family transcriptional regulator, Mn-dependent transcriptional regulator